MRRRDEIRTALRCLEEMMFSYHCVDEIARDVLYNAYAEFLYLQEAMKNEQNQKKKQKAEAERNPYWKMPHRTTGVIQGGEKWNF